MKNGTQLTRAFFAQDTLKVARNLLGARLVRLENGRRLSGVIIETEAYRGEEDLGCHCRAGRTKRTEIMYGLPGYSYIYFVYGMHWLLNFVTERDGFPGAVLIRAIIPDEGQGIIAVRRSERPRAEWTNGPAKLCQALGINGQQNGQDACAPNASIFVERGTEIPAERVSVAARVGLNTVPEPWKSIPWRFLAKV
ncbi:MAG: DNA-3-methyladenine glycosylase [Chloroflexota bacterium]|nr:MAG: hypothetical protein B6243_00345 [Anaerolineaceae bacterium 4572_5.2]RLD05750.1 MAG: DNA-3-methyladenine glycosylase [Chloroflexota bacterium]